MEAKARTVTAGEVERAAQAVAPYVRQTPLLPATRLSRAAGNRMERLCRNNAVGQGRPRYLGIVFDGEIVSWPSLREVIKRDVSISGGFTRPQCDAMADLIRAGTLPVPLKPLPVDEIQVEPKAR